VPLRATLLYPATRVQQPGHSQHQEREQAEPRGQQAEPVELALGQVVAADEYDNPVLKKMQPLIAK
jgi:hypothetical protein